MNHIRPVSPIDGIHLKDDFHTGKDDVAAGLMGELNWELVTIGNASTTAFQTARPYGSFKDTTAASADGDGESYRSFTDGLVLNGKGGGFAFRCKLNDQIASNNFRIGVEDSVTATDPGSGIWVESDGGVISLECFSNDHGDSTSAAAAQQCASADYTLTSGTTMVVDTWHDFRVEWTGINGQGGPYFVDLYVDDVKSASSICNIDDDEEVELKITHWQDSGGALAVELEVDYYEFWQWR
jgi:hypothetical protein